MYLFHCFADFVSLSLNFAVSFGFFCQFIKEEPRDPEIDADMAVEPRTVLNRDFFSATSSISSTDTDMGGVNVISHMI